MLNFDDAKERARRGATLLDERREDDWREKINLKTLDLSSPHCCILGQLYEDGYYGGIKELFGVDCEEISDDAFDNIVFYGFSDNKDYYTLQRAWITILTEE